MKLTDYKFEVAEINGVKCSVIEKDVDKSRMEFLSTLLPVNGLVVMVDEKPLPATDEVPEPGVTYTVGVTDITFNPVIAVYQRRLKTPEGELILPVDWEEREKSAEWYWKEKA